MRYARQFHASDHVRQQVRSRCAQNAAPVQNSDCHLSQPAYGAQDAKPQAPAKTQNRARRKPTVHPREAR